MIRNYLTIAIRNLLRNKVFSFINIFGLALGLSCSMLILLWVQDELTWDRFHPNIDQLYRVYINRPADNGIYTQTTVQLPLWEELKTTPGIRYVSPTDNDAEKQPWHTKTSGSKNYPMGWGGFFENVPVHVY